MAEETHTTVLELEDRFSRTLRGAGRSVAGFNRRLDGATRRVRAFQAGIAGVGRRVWDFGRSAFAVFTRLAMVIAGATLAVAGLAAAIGAALTSVGLRAAKVAARVEVLWNTVRLLAEHAGVAFDAVREKIRILERQGITTRESLEGMTKWLTSGLPLGAVTKLARAAQDMAAAWALNSSELFGRFIEAIATSNMILLGTVGITEGLTDAYGKFAAKMGIAGKGAGTLGDQLTTLQKKQAILGLIMEWGAKYTGAYEEAMGFAGKQATSLARLYETLAQKVGQRLLPAYSAWIKFLSDVTKHLTQAAEEGKGFTKVWEALGGAAERVLTIARRLILGFINYLEDTAESLGDWIGNVFSQENLDRAIRRLLFFGALAVNLAQTIKMGWQDIQTFLNEGFMPAGWLRNLTVRMLKIMALVTAFAAAWYTVAAAVYGARLAMGDVTALGGAALSAMLAGALWAGAVVLRKEALGLEEGRPGAKFTLIEVLVALTRRAFQFPGGAGMIYGRWMKELGLDKAAAVMVKQTDATEKQTDATEAVTAATVDLAGIVRKIFGGGKIAGLGISPLEIERMRLYRREQMAGGRDRIVIQFPVTAQNKMTEAVQDIVVDAVAQILTGTSRSYSFNRTGG